MDAVNSLCQTIEYLDSIPDCYDAIRSLVLSKYTDYGQNFAALKLRFGQHYNIYPDDIDSALFARLKDSVIAIEQRHPNYPEYCYLVVTENERIAMIWIDAEERDATFDLGGLELSDAKRTIKLHSVFTGSAVREQLDAAYPGAADTLFRQLPGGSSEDSDWEGLDLVKIWPIDEP